MLNAAVRGSPVGRERSGARRQALVVVSVSVAAACVIAAVWILAQSEPRSWWIREVVGAASIVSAVVAVVVVALRARRFVAAAPAIIGLSILVATAWSATSLHWRWSREDFAQVVAGRDIRCGTASACSLGWWRTTGTTRLPSMVIVWEPTYGCEAGEGLAHPIGPDPGLERFEARVVAADLPSDDVLIDHGRDGWYSVCFVT